MKSSIGEIENILNCIELNESRDTFNTKERYEDVKFTVKAIRLSEIRFLSNEKIDQGTIVRSTSFNYHKIFGIIQFILSNGYSVNLFPIFVVREQDSFVVLRGEDTIVAIVALLKGYIPDNGFITASKGKSLNLSMKEVEVVKKLELSEFLVMNVFPCTFNLPRAAQLLQKVEQSKELNWFERLDIYLRLHSELKRYKKMMDRKVVVEQSVGKKFGKSTFYRDMDRYQRTLDLNIPLELIHKLLLYTDGQILNAEVYDNISKASDNCWEFVFLYVGVLLFGPSYVRFLNKNVLEILIIVLRDPNVALMEEKDILTCVQSSNRNIFVFLNMVQVNIPFNYFHKNNDEIIEDFLAQNYTRKSNCYFGGAKTRLYSVNLGPCFYNHSFQSVLSEIFKVGNKQRFGQKYPEFTDGQFHVNSIYELAKYIPSSCKTFLDLGCSTGTLLSLISLVCLNLTKLHGLEICPERVAYFTQKVSTYIPKISKDRIHVAQAPLTTARLDDYDVIYTFQSKFNETDKEWIKNQVSCSSSVQVAISFEELYLNSKIWKLSTAFIKVKLPGINDENDRTIFIYRRL